VVHAVAIDITERKHAEEALQLADRRKDEFLAMLAHELRNPLAPISSAADMLRIAYANEPRVKQISEIVARQVAHMRHLVDDLLDVSRVTRGLVTIIRKPLDLRHVVSEAVEQSRPLVEARRHQLAVTLPDAPLMVDGDHTRLVQVVANLINNAAKYTHEGGRIDVTLAESDGHARLAVHDNGTGIGPDLLPVVFDLFTQGSRTLDRAQGGLGLGLALVRKLVELHAGQRRRQQPRPGPGQHLHRHPPPRLNSGSELSFWFGVRALFVEIALAQCSDPEQCALTPNFRIAARHWFDEGGDSREDCLPINEFGALCLLSLAWSASPYRRTSATAPSRASGCSSNPMPASARCSTIFIATTSRPSTAPCSTAPVQASACTACRPRSSRSSTKMSAATSWRTWRPAWPAPAGAPPNSGCAW
jgi:two-component sensor histidine kinase